MTTNNQSISSKQEKFILLFFLISATLPIFLIDMPRSIATFSSAIGVAFYLAFLFISKQKPKLSRPTIYIVLATLALAIASLSWAKFEDETSKNIVKLIMVLPPQILLISLVQSLQSAHIKKYSIVFCYGLMTASVLLCFEYLSDGMLFKTIRGLPLEGYLNHSEFNRGMTGLVIYAFSGWLLLTSNTKSVAMKLVYVAPLLLALILTESRAAQLSMLAGFGALFLFPYKYKATWITLKVMLVAFILTAPFLSTYTYKNYAATLQEAPMMESAFAGHRLEIWDFTSRYALTEPLHGHGLRVTGNIRDFDSKHVYSQSDRVLHPHNFAVQIWIEFGVIGAILASIIIFYILTLMQKNFSIAQQKIVLPTFATILVPAMVSFGMWQSWWIALIFHGTAIALLACRIIEEKEKEKEKDKA